MYPPAGPHVEEASLIAGGSNVQTLWPVARPLVLPAPAATGVLAFLYASNDVVYALIPGGDITIMPLLFFTFATDRLI